MHDLISQKIVGSLSRSNPRAVSSILISARVANVSVCLTIISPFAVEKVPTLNLHGVLCGPEGKSSAPLSQVVILWYERNAERG